MFKKIEETDRKQVLTLMKTVIEGLERPEFYMQDTPENIENMFEEDFIYSYGAYEKEKLVGMTQLYVDQQDLKRYKVLFGLENEQVCELGSALVLKAYRNQGILQNLINRQIQVAKEKKFTYMIATVHPENVPSYTALEKCAFYLKGHAIIENQYDRNLYVIKL